MPESASAVQRDHLVARAMQRPLAGERLHLDAARLLEPVDEVERLRYATGAQTSRPWLRRIIALRSPRCATRRSFSPRLKAGPS